MNLAIFLKAPVAGKVKTRLSPPLSEEEALQLYTAFVEDLLDAASRTHCRGLYLFHEGPPPTDFLPEDLVRRLNDPPGRLQELRQGVGDLGQRLDRAFLDLADRRALPALVVGSDHPDLPTLSMDHLMVALPGADLILGEASDGGAWGIGVRSPQPELFVDIPWSRPNTARALLDRAEQLGLSSRSIAPWHDVDEIDDLRQLWDRLRNGESDAPRTHAWLRDWRRREEFLGSSE